MLGFVRRMRVELVMISVRLCIERKLIIIVIIWMPSKVAASDISLLLFLVMAGCIPDNLVNAASRRHGFNNAKSLLRRIRAKIGVQLIRRAVRMIQACLPKLSNDEILLLTGVNPEEGDMGAAGNGNCDPTFYPPLEQDGYAWNSGDS